MLGNKKRTGVTALIKYSHHWLFIQQFLLSMINHMLLFKVPIAWEFMFHYHSQIRL